MTIVVEKMPEEKIIILEVHPPVAMPDDPAATTEEPLRFLEEVGGSICRITDYTRVKLSFGDLVQGMAVDKAITNPNVVNVLVGTDEMVRLGGESFKQEQYGGIDVSIVSTQAEALEKARAMLESS